MSTVTQLPRTEPSNCRIVERDELPEVQARLREGERLRLESALRWSERNGETRRAAEISAQLATLELDTAV
jgi:hypothetical protein